MIVGTVRIRMKQTLFCLILCTCPLWGEWPTRAGDGRGIPGDPADAHGLWAGAGELSAWKNGEGWLVLPSDAIALAGPWLDGLWWGLGFGEGVGTDKGPPEGEGAGNIADGDGTGWCIIEALGFGDCWLKWLMDGGEAKLASEVAAGL